MSMLPNRVCAVKARGEQYLSEPLCIEMENFDSEQLALMPDFVDFCENKRGASLKLLTVAFMGPMLCFLRALHLAARAVVLSDALML
jgi:hypothetical protein